MHLSIKVVVGALLLLVSMITMIACQLPPAMYLQQDASVLAEQAAQVTTSKSLAFNSQHLQRMVAACHVLHRAASRQDILNVEDMLLWVGTVVEKEDFGAGLFSDSGQGIYISAQPSTTTEPIVPGSVYVANLTAGEHYDVALYEVATRSQQKDTWQRVPTSVDWDKFPQVAAWKGSSDSMMGPRWARLVPFSDYSGSVSDHTESGLFYGGPVGDGTNRQYVMFVMRGSWFSQYFTTLSISEHGAALLIDAVSGAFVAGNINDPTGKDNNTQLMPISELRDPRIAPILSAPGSLDNLLTCTPPCTFTYWPYNNEMHPSSEEDNTFFTGPLYRSRVIIHVERVCGASSYDDSELDLRLITALPTDDVIGGFILILRRSLYITTATVIVLVVALLVTIALSLRGLSDVEEEMLRMALMLDPHQHPNPPHSSSPSHASRAGPCDVKRSFSSSLLHAESAFVEVNNIFVAVRALSRQLYTLRAFSTPAMTSFDNANTTGSREADAALRQSIAPYTATLATVESRGLWQVPVTTVVMRFLRPPTHPAATWLYDDLEKAHSYSNAVHAVVHKLVLRIPGASVDGWFGDYVMMHLNGRSRTPNHCIAAVVLAQKCLRAIENKRRRGGASRAVAPYWRPPSVHCGIASMVAHCGFIGPATLRTFTVVSSGPAQARRLSSSRSLLAATFCALRYRFYGRALRIYWPSDAQNIHGGVEWACTGFIFEPCCGDTFCPYPGQLESCGHCSPKNTNAHRCSKATAHQRHGGVEWACTGFIFEPCCGNTFSPYPGHLESCGHCSPTNTNAQRCRNAARRQ
ncbi:membrane-associated protein, putative [Bodo saltans]|uniref:Membrane-associated protein, putative n=1 Tax=Bodo saltans TaxID=75058 RepID=A0A0S4IR10_BODSA|nr:membrane-associated protein, putative [Bodo saltans]|eukprot:CUE74709.1 membrane-associated protein, putative [Bodo saltans]